MSQPTISADGIGLRLGPVLGKGGEGTVYAIENRPGFALKLYSLEDLREREKKIEAMVAAKLADQTKLVSFPVSVARTESGRFAGFLMPLVSGCKAIHEVYGPKARNENFPGADYRFLVRAAYNVACAIGAVHKAGCVIGDINHSGILVSKEAVAALIDADSFQFSANGANYRCHVGVPEYTPPELQGVTLSAANRTPNHDAFSLAVLIFQLLMMGKHPFSGAFRRGDLPLESAIKEFRFAYSMKRSTEMQPPKGFCTIDIFPHQIREAFEDAFSPNGVNGRPTPLQWLGLLKELESNLIKCSTNSLHYYPNAAAFACPWCLIERQFGIQFFVPRVPAFAPAEGFADASIAGFDLSSVISELQRITVPTPISLAPAISSASPKPSPEAISLASKGIESKALGVVGLICAGLFLFYKPLLWFVWGPIGFWAFRQFSLKTSHSGHVRTRNAALQTAWRDKVRAWYEASGFAHVQEIRARLERARADLAGAPGIRAADIAEYKRNRRSLQLQKWLEGFYIERAKISGVGTAKTAALASFGIETAADVELSAVMAVPGFGPKNAEPLIDWRASLEKHFVYSEAPTALDATCLAAIDQRCTNKIIEAKRILAAGPAELRAAIRTLEARAKTYGNGLSALHMQWLQLHADAEHIGALAALEPLDLDAAIKLMPQPVSASQVGSKGKAGNGATSVGPSSHPRPNSPQASSSAQAPLCPNCSARMVKRTARRGRNKGGTFWGCTTYPRCKGTRSI
ncbi:MAG: topoisomerase DNA-binding C4 zinc finger domain-containing protein [Gammaproteobacteria bacterium]|nr:topoisomerase DNA-binding C4 zinc finger domain-containing protein [Gammaproteobacteria bacterium]